MDNDEFEKRMRELEYFHGLRALPGAWVVIRVDGRGVGSEIESLNAVEDKDAIDCGEGKTLYISDEFSEFAKRKIRRFCADPIDIALIEAQPPHAQL